MLGYDHSTVCLETVLSLCYSEISEEALDHMFLHAPEVIRKIRSDGAVTDVFLDDLETNIQGARALGIHGIVFKDARQAVDELRKFNVSIS